jgi:chromosome segregation ATPase
VWERVCAVLRDPRIIERELAKQRYDGRLERELAAIERRLSDNGSKQSTLAQTIAMLDDPTPVVAQLNALSAGKRALEADRDALERRMADVEADRARLRTLTEWAEHVAAKLESATYDEKRLALEALGVKVRVFRTGTVDAEGNPNPKYEITMRPVVTEEHIVYTPARHG